MVQAFDVAGFEIMGISVVAAIIGLIEGLKTMGMRPRWSLPVAVAIGLLFTLLLQTAIRWPGVRSWVEAVFLGLAIGLSACGLYGGGKALSRK